MSIKRLSVSLSPKIYEALRVEARERDVTAPRCAASILEEALAERLAALRAASPEAAPSAEDRLLAQFLACEDDRDWSRMYELREQMPESLAASDLVRQQHGFALNRDGRPEEAERVLLALLEEQGPSPETCGILGRVYKDRWKAGRATGELPDLAVATYLQGHDADPSNPYPGINALTLMTFYPSPPERYDPLLAEVTQAVAARRSSPDRGYWDHATRLELALHRNDEAEATRALTAALAADKVGWMVESTLRNLRLLRVARVEREAREVAAAPETPVAGDQPEGPRWDEKLPPWLPFIEAALAGTLPVEPEAEAAPRKKPAEPKDLQKVEGIGPKISGLLAAAGITSCDRLAITDVRRLREILHAGGSRYHLADPGTWPQQAALAAAGRWQELRKLQDVLIGGRRPEDLRSARPRRPGPGSR